LFKAVEQTQPLVDVGEQSDSESDEVVDIFKPKQPEEIKAAEKADDGQEKKPVAGSGFFGAIVNRQSTVPLKSLVTAGKSAPEEYESEDASSSE